MAGVEGELAAATATGTAAATATARPAASAAPAPAERWVPGVLRLYAWTFLMLLSPAVASMAAWRAGLVDPSSPLPAVAAFLLLGTFAFLAHRSYERARRRLRDEPGLRGRWLVENAWWIVVAACMLPLLAGTLAVALLLLR